MPSIPPQRTIPRPPRAAVLSLLALFALVGAGAAAVASMRLDRADVHVRPAPDRSIARVAPQPRRTASPASHPATAAPRTPPTGRTARSVLDEHSETVARLDPALLGALRRAANAAAAQGVRITVTSGWRSASQQAELLREAVAEYGSEAEAARWVATPERSEHVRGAAVDLGPARAVTWLARHGAAFGLCQVYRNEPWHFELRPSAPDHGCPAPYADPTQDPRMQG